ncbi:2-dehydro-3-deoxy-6-phosphogalactonate aldolase [Marinomonas atlantica]|uniref:2-dehydro-3-deoxy-6-phosphogalactonate aldolase n=1 Tax=Marinomonas atlantica TaxID=1806668 RepID=UPI00082C1B40|nr:2-dehydro-3-deoxy-6-phosphogalactonate aldolase [Marinomonas atlantica]MCO4784488.1 2-dehydro-3-deoxy-6-phosphogalactonate aldolase [Marinomonas atlantica]
MSFDQHMKRLPLVAILRGIKPNEVLEHGRALVAAGFEIIEVPMNSPNPIESIALLQKQFGEKVLVGAGTVTTIEQVDQLYAVNAKLMVCPHTDVPLIRYAKSLGMFALPGFFTATEALAALNAGADGLKLFPAEGISSPKIIKAFNSILPQNTWFCPVGGVTPSNLEHYVAEGATGFGLGSALYRVGQSVEQTSYNALAFVTAWHELEVK